MDPSKSTCCSCTCENAASGLDQAEINRGDICTSGLDVCKTPRDGLHRHRREGQREERQRDRERKREREREISITNVCICTDMHSCTCNLRMHEARVYYLEGSANRSAALE